MRLRLFIHGSSPRSETALRNVRALCQAIGEERVQLEIVDVRHDAVRAEMDRVVATPTLVKLFPLPPVRIIGDMSDQQVIAGLLDPPPARPF